MQPSRVMHLARAALLVGLIDPAFAQPNMMLACPEATYTVKKFETLPLPTGDNKNAYRMCFRLVGAMDNSPSKAEVWSINDGGIDSSTKTGQDAFCHTGRSYQKTEFKIGAVPMSTRVYWNWIHLYSTSEDEAKQLAKITVPPASPRTVRGVLLNPCIAECKQAPPPPLSKTYEERGCSYDCDNSGRWARDCPKLGQKDPATGKTVTHEK